MSEHPLKHVLAPRSIAVVGASNNPQKTGYFYMEKLLQAGYKGQIYPVHPQQSEILGLPAYPNLAAVPGEVDLAYVVVPGEAVIQVMRDCIAKGSKAALVVSAGFSEVADEEGKRRARELQELLDAGRGTRVIGPNCMGLYNAALGLTFHDAPIKEGKIGVIAQSGSITVDIIKSGVYHNLGFSVGVSSGNEMDLNLCDYLEYFAADPATGIIAAYVEGIKEGQRFVRLAGEITPKKPIIIWKGGRTEAGARAASSHTGSLAGERRIYSAAFRQAGVVPATGLPELTAFLQAFSMLERPAGNGVCIVTGPGGPGVAISDACNEAGLSVPALSEATRQSLSRLLPSFAGTRNPIDITMASLADSTLLGQCAEIAAADPAVDAILAVVGPGEHEGLIEARGKIGKPLLAYDRSPAGLVEQNEMLEEAGVPVFNDVVYAARAIAALLGKVYL
jgi:acyl-CoA synthetase (NDP forming)